MRGTLANPRADDWIGGCRAAMLIPMRPLAVVILLLVGLAPTAAQAKVSPTERRIIGSVDRQLPAARALLERTVNVNSGTLNLAGVREVGTLFRAEFDALGFATR